MNGAGRTIRAILPPIIALAAVIALWISLKRLFGWEDFLIPAPLAVMRALANHGALLMRAMWTTAEAAGAGFGASILIGIGVGALLSSNRWVERAVYPF